MSSIGELSAHLDARMRDFQGGDAAVALERLCSGLTAIRRAAPAAEWTSTLVPACRQHPLARLLRHDPYTARALAKPRGYPGDAETLDFIYQDPPSDLSCLSSRLLAAIRESPNAKSVLWRMRFVAEEIDKVARDRPGARVLAVACGHLREAHASQAIREYAVSELVALDQDGLSVLRVGRECAGLPVTAVQAGIGDIIRGRLDLGRFDLVYAAGLYDYLNYPVASALSQSLLGLLEPGGELLIGNFIPDNHGRSYMETFMDWHLVCRFPEELEALSFTASATSVDTFLDPLGNVAYMRMGAGLRSSAGLTCS